MLKKWKQCIESKVMLSPFLTRFLPIPLLFSEVTLLIKLCLTCIRLDFLQESTHMYRSKHKYNFKI